MIFYHIEHQSSSYIVRDDMGKYYDSFKSRKEAQAYIYELTQGKKESDK